LYSDPESAKIRLEKKQSEEEELLLALTGFSYYHNCVSKKPAFCIPL
jgi:hypothetical protein